MSVKMESVRGEKVTIHFERASACIRAIAC